MLSIILAAALAAINPSNVIADNNLICNHASINSVEGDIICNGQFCYQVAFYVRDNPKGGICMDITVTVWHDNNGQPGATIGSYAILAGCDGSMQQPNGFPDQLWFNPEFQAALKAGL
jgi:hypothetical protein